MKERQILFSGEMVRAILDGRKTQTRRVIKPQPIADESFEVGYYNPRLVGRDGEEYPGEKQFGMYWDGWDIRCPYGAPGDRLWVRESWRYACCSGYTPANKPAKFTVTLEYRASYDKPLYGDRGGRTIEVPEMRYGGKLKKNLEVGWKPSIHMPRAYSRIDLEITGVRVERVQDISEEDAVAEGVYDFIAAGRMTGLEKSMRSEFTDLWNSINSKRGYSWDTNPLVWVIAFRRAR